MNKQEWLDCKDLNQMLREINNRKRQLFALACCRRVEHLMLDQRSKDCLDKLEDFIDGKIGREELETVRQTAWAAATNAWNAYRDAPAYWAATATAHAYAWSAADASARAVANNKAERLKQIEILRDIYNPYLENLKFSSLAMSLASQVYSGDGSARGILSDYLEEEGYPDEIVLHLKSGEHYKGCWLIDQILDNL